MEARTARGYSGAARVGRSGASDVDMSGGSGCEASAWFFQVDRVFASGRLKSSYFHPPPFAAGDVVTIELELASGIDGKMRVRLAGKTPRQLTGLPEDGMLYPIVGLSNSAQRISMVPPP